MIKNSLGLHAFIYTHLMRSAVKIDDLQFPNASHHNTLKVCRLAIFVHDVSGLIYGKLCPVNGPNDYICASERQRKEFRARGLQQGVRDPQGVLRDGAAKY